MIIERIERERAAPRVGTRRVARSASRSGTPDEARAATQPGAARGAEQNAAVRRRIRGAQIGRLVAVETGGAPIVDFPGAAAGPRVAILAAPCPHGLLEGAVGRHVVLLFEGGNPAHPIVVGWVQETAREPIAPRRVVRVDGRRIVLAAESEIQLRCGAASLTLTADGRIVIKGKNLLAHADEMHKIRGAAVRIN